MAAAGKELWCMVRPGGRLAIKTWGPDLFEPANGAFWEAILEERPYLVKGFNHGERISTHVDLREMLREAGIADFEIVAVAGSHLFNSAENWWLIAIGSGHLGTLARLAPPAFSRVRSENIRCLRASNTTSLQANVQYATAIKGSRLPVSARL